MSDENNTFENNDQQGNETPVENNNYSNYSYENQGSGNDYTSGKGQGTGLGTASMVCGILAILALCGSFATVYISPVLALIMYLTPVLGIVAIVLGIVQLVKNESKGMAIAGIVCGAIGLLMFVGLICMALWLISSGAYEQMYEQILNGQYTY